MKLRKLRKKTILKADNKILVFVNGVCEIKKITKDIQFFLDNGYIKLEESQNVETANK